MEASRVGTLCSRRWPVPTFRFFHLSPPKDCCVVLGVGDWCNGRLLKDSKTVGSRGGSHGSHRSRNMNLRWPTPKEQHVDTQDFSCGQCHPPVLIWIYLDVCDWCGCIHSQVWQTPVPQSRVDTLSDQFNHRNSDLLHLLLCRPRSCTDPLKLPRVAASVILVSKNKPGGANPCCWYRTSSSPWWPAVWSDFGVSTSWRMNAAAAATKHHGFVTFFSAGFLGDGRLPWRQTHAQFKGGVSCCGWEDPKPSRTNTTAHLDHSGSMNSAVWPFAQTKKGD